MSGALPAGFREIEAAEIKRAFGSLFYLRLLGIPVVVGVPFSRWLESGRSVDTLVELGALAVGMFVFLGVLRRRKMRGKFRELDLKILAGFDIVFLLSICALSGGLDSPFLMLLPVVASLNALASQRSWALTYGAGMVACVPILLLVGGTRPFFTIAMMAYGVTIGVAAARGMRRTFDQMLIRALEARDDVLKMHSEQLQALTTLSGEIAHELKTPLSSVKGLTGLAMMEIDDPVRCRERLEVLRNEAVRMQKILDEFLNFSRPLSPLALASIDALDVAEGVVELFEGLSHERKIPIQLSGDPAEVRCDPRKVKQLLINLVQNAVEASAPGTQVDIEVEARPSDAAIRVLDRGHGLESGVEGRVFEPGVTTKARGSGLGLTISRSLAQQHGGSLTLRSRDGGGCIAELVLPRAAGASAQEGRAA